MAEVPHLVEVQAEHGSESFRVIGLTESDRERTRDFTLEHRVNYPILANAKDLFESFGVNMIWGSAFFLVDPEGQIVADELDAALTHLPTGEG